MHVDTLSWEPCPNYPETDERDDVIGPRAGSCAAVVGTRMYVWSGRDGYKKVWNNQVLGFQGYYFYLQWI